MENQSTVIGSNTIIKGDIKTSDNLIIEGGVNGNIETRGVLKLCGKVIGDISASEVHLQKAEVKGTVISDGEVTMDQDSLVIGDITGKSADISGSVKGNVDCEGFVRLTETAIVSGNIISSDNEKASGAIIEGQFIHSHDELDVNEYFDTRSRGITLGKIESVMEDSLKDDFNPNAEEPLEDGGIMNLKDDFDDNSGDEPGKDPENDLNDNTEED